MEAIRGHFKRWLLMTTLVGVAATGWAFWWEEKFFWFMAGSFWGMIAAVGILLYMFDDWVGLGRIEELEARNERLIKQMNELMNASVTCVLAIIEERGGMELKYQREYQGLDINGKLVDYDRVMWGVAGEFEIWGETLRFYMMVAGVDKPWEDPLWERQIKRAFASSTIRAISERVKFREILLRKFGKVT